MTMEELRALTEAANAYERYQADVCKRSCQNDMREEAIIADDLRTGYHGRYIAEQTGRAI